MLSRIAALPLWGKVLLAFVVLALCIVLSPFMIIVALIVMIIAILALIFRALRRRPLRNWGIVALTSLLLVIVFAGISEALYGSEAPQQASSPSEPKEEAKPAPPETTTEPTTAKTTAPPETTMKTTNEPTPAPSEPKESAQDEEPEYDATTRVTRVVDGDTIRISPAVEGKEEVRLIGMDTPETKDPDCAVQPYGEEASRFATTELQGEEVGLEFDQEREDRYDRLLAYVYKDSEMFNETLLEQGYAQVYIISPNDRYAERFAEAQDEAQAAERGIWALSASEQSELANRDNAIGSSSCTPKTTTPPEAPPQPKEQPQEQPTPWQVSALRTTAAP
jgi:micrococcal nuclease